MQSHWVNCGAFFNHEAVRPTIPTNCLSTQKSLPANHTAEIRCVFGVSVRQKKTIWRHDASVGTAEKEDFRDFECSEHGCQCQTSCFTTDLLGFPRHHNHLISTCIFIIAVEFTDRVARQIFASFGICWSARIYSEYNAISLVYIPRIPTSIEIYVGCFRGLDDFWQVVQ